MKEHYVYSIKSLHGNFYASYFMHFDIKVFRRNEIENEMNRKLSLLKTMFAVCVQLFNFLYLRSDVYH